MAVLNLEDPYRKKVAAVVDELVDIARSEGASSILFILETPRRRHPIVGVVGRLRADPHRAIGQLVVMKQRLVQMVRGRVDFADSE